MTWILASIEDQATQSRVWRILERKYKEADELSKRQLYAFMYGASIRTLRRSPVTESG